MTPQAAFDRQVDFLKPEHSGGAIGVAVSGGSDSMALLLLAETFAKERGFSVKAATVDHGLRAEAAEEAAKVASFCAERDIEHTTLRWSDWDGAGNVQSKARQARYELLTEWALTQKVGAVLLGHTMDDQAETFLMGLARGSGVDGLSGMPMQKDNFFRRPLLEIKRADLRRMLDEQGVGWIDDPSNDDTRYDRVKARQMIGHLTELGLTTERLVQTADHMTRARNSLRAHADAYIADHVHCEGPDIIMPLSALKFGWSDVEPRVFSAAIMWIGGADYRPRFLALCDAAAAVVAGETRTLHGAKIISEGTKVRLIREFGACSEVVQSQGGEAALVWDKKWRIWCNQRTSFFGAKDQLWPSDLTVRALGKAVSDVKDWRLSRLSHASAMATPGIFDGETLVSAPGIGFNADFTARFVADFHS